MGTQKTDNFDSADLHQNTQWKKKKKKLTDQLIFSSTNPYWILCTHIKHNNHKLND